MPPPAFRFLGPALRQLRRMRGYSQKDLAALADITTAMLSSYERGRVRPSLVTLGRLLDALDSNLTELGRVMRQRQDVEEFDKEIRGID